MGPRIVDLLDKHGLNFTETAMVINGLKYANDEATKILITDFPEELRTPLLELLTKHDVS